MSRWPGERWLRPREVLLSGAGAWDLGEAAAYPDFGGWCDAHPGCACRVNVSSAWTTELPVDPALPLADDAELIDWARVQLRSHGGDASGAWPCAAWQAGAARGVSVLHGLDLGRLRDAAHARRIDLRLVRPWWAGVLPRSLRHVPRLRAPRARLVVVEGARVASVELSTRSVTAAATAYLDAPTAEALADWCTAQPPAETVVFGHGLAEGPLPGVHVLPGLHGDSPAAAWQGTGR